MRKITAVIPCYNEEKMLPIFFKKIEDILVHPNKNKIFFEFIFVNDGSRDNTLFEIKKILNESKDSAIKYIDFSRNFGKEAALYAGLEHATGDYICVMDADLQDPPELLIKMFEIIETQDYDCVGCRRVDRSGEPLIRSFFAKKFYQIINKISDVEMVDGARDFRLMKKAMVDSILDLKEVNRFSKGLFSWVGYNVLYLEYENVERVAGETSWSFFSLLKYSIEGIINFSDAPLNIASIVGTISCFASFMATIIVFLRTIIFGNPTSGWTSLVIIILFMGGLHLLSLGIIGKYISKIFLETKKRPIYIARETNTNSHEDRTK